MGCFVLTKKRLGIVGAIFALAISLTDCANTVSPYAQNGGIGYGTCSGALGNFSVTLQPTSDNYTYNLAIEPSTGVTPGDIASVYIANGQKGYKQLVTEVVIEPNNTITAGPITADDLMNYDVLAIVPFSPNTDFLNQQANADTYCYIPQPGDQAY